MSSGRSFRTLLALAVDGLRRKIGRNVLTMSGVLIGVFALTMIVALGEGMQGLVRATVSSEDNLRQIGLSPGFGLSMDDAEEVRIEGEMSDARRQRLRRAALARRRPGTFIGRRAQALDAAALAEVEARPHVDRATPIVLERYRLESGARRTEATATLGIDVYRRRYEERVIAGSYFSSPLAREVLIHEYLAWQWGFESEAELSGLIGARVTLVGIQNPQMADAFAPGFAAAFMSRVDLDVLTEEELDLMPGMLEKLIRSFWGWRPAAEGEDGAELSAEFTIVGVVRELEPDDPFNVIEDGNARQADLFLPQERAVELFMASPVNRELGFARAFVTVDDAGHASEVETDLRDLGYTAISVAAVVARIEDFVGALTIVVAFLTGIALLVAALGIVNTMITSVLERTREIGLWKAIGATGRQVRTVFLLEAGLLGFLGGLVGLVLALLLMIPLENVAQRMIAERSAFPLRGAVFLVPMWLPLAGPILATLLAMLAALYPAHRAARIDPVRALHHE